MTSPFCIPTSLAGYPFSTSLKTGFIVVPPQTKVKNSNKLTNNQVKNETNNNTKNEVKNELNNNENTNTTTNEPKEETPKTDLEKAIDIVKKDWGADSTVYFAQDGQKESGEYIICVRDTETTSAKAWYTVNVQTGTFVKE